MDATRGYLPRPEDITFLDRNGIRITGCWMDISGRRYAVRELDDVWTIAGPWNPLALSSFKVLGVLGLLGAIVSPYLEPAAWVGLACVLSVPLAVGLVALRLRPRSHVLWADYRGRREQVYACGDQVWFNQVCRALNRARDLRVG